MSTKQPKKPKQPKFNKHNLVIDETILSSSNLIEQLIKKDEEIIKNYIERIIYTSALSEDTNSKLTQIFEKAKLKLI
jgi:hypothetical protein